jgi:hypothetical protein
LSESSPAGKWDATRPAIFHARHDSPLQLVPKHLAYFKITNQAPPFRAQKSPKTLHREEKANAEPDFAAQNTIPPSLETHPRGNFPSPSGLPSTPRSPVSNINRIRPAASLRTGLVQQWVQSEGSCLASATPLNVRVLFLCKVSKNLPCKKLIYLLVPRNRLCDSCLGILVNVVFTSMTEKHSTSRFDLGNQIAPFHANSNSSTFLIPGRCPSEKVS